MIEPYKMIVVNLVLLSLLCIALFAYHFMYPKKKLNFFLVFLSFSILPIISIFRVGDYESGDFNIHAYRTIEFFGSLRDGQLMPSWPENLNATYGYPLFIFLNSLPYYLIVFFKFIGFGFIDSLKAYLIFVYLGSGVLFWLFAKSIFKNKLAVFAASIMYLFTPYHLLDLHFRAAVGELLAFLMLPLTFLAFKSMLLSKNTRSVFLAGAIYGLFLMSHQAISVFSLLLLVPYALLMETLHTLPLRRVILQTFSAIGLGLILSIYIWLPHLTHSQFTYGFMLAKNTVSFPKIWQLFYSPYRYGLLFQGPNGELSFAIGYTQLLVILSSIFFVIKHILIVKRGTKIKKHQSLLNKLTQFFIAVCKYKSFPLLELLFWTSMLLVLFFLMTNYSSGLWESIHILNTAQFSTRLLVLATFCVSILFGYLIFFIRTKKLFVYSLIFLTITYTILNWGHRRVIPEIGDETLIQQVWSSTIAGEGFYGLGSPKWVNPSDPWIHKKPKLHLEILSGKAKLRNEQRTSVYHSYIMCVVQESTFKENTLYFPGWKLFVNKKEVAINPNNRHYPGVITFSLKPGLYLIELQYKDLPFHLAAKAVTVLGYLGIFCYFSFRRIHDYLTKRRNLL